MEITQTGIKDLVVLTPRVFKDERGYFFESYNKEAFRQAGIPDEFVQDNQSCSQKGVLRGLHFQKPPFGQGKLVRVIRGAVLDVAVDLRSESPTFGKYFKVELSEDNFKMLWLPVGFAHGFLSLADDTVFSYKCTGLYNKASEGSIRWDDPQIGIDWGADSPIVSEKDSMASSLDHYRGVF